MNELVSVIIPVYNGEKVITRCINSLIHQTYVDIEIIIVDDGSSDETERICKGLLKIEPRIRYFRQCNQGVAYARNVGMKISKGKYLCFVDADDYTYPLYVETLLYYLKQYHVSIAACNYQKLQEGEHISKKCNIRKIKLMSKEDALSSLFYRKEMMGYPFLKLFARDILTGMSFPTEYALGEDFQFVYSVFQNSSDIIYIDSVMYIYMQNNGSATHNLSIEPMEKIWIKLIEYLEENKNDEQICRAIVTKIFITSIDFYIQLDKEKRNILFKKKLKEYIKEHASQVFRDKQAGRIDRGLALIGILNVDLLMQIAWLGKRINAKTIIFRKAI